MLGYRHVFHAGNHGDVLKHMVLVHLLDHLAAKEKPYWYIDTHAGAGRYSLNRGFATQLHEYAEGIGRLWDATALPAGVARYLEIVRALNPGGKLKHYPGSPWIARACARQQDRLWFYELHPADYNLLSREFAADARIRIECEDGFAALKGLLPPRPRRALVMMDPSYELKSDYAWALTALRDGLGRFPTGVYAVWYPILSRRESRDMPHRLAALGGRWLHATLVPRDAASERGLHGSGLFVINPPFTLRAMLHDALPRLAELMGDRQTAGFELAGSDTPD